MSSIPINMRIIIEAEYDTLGTGNVCNEPNWPACGSIHCAMTSRSFSRAMLESPPFSGSLMKKPSLGLGLQDGKPKHISRLHRIWAVWQNYEIWTESFVCFCEENLNTLQTLLSSQVRLSAQWAVETLQHMNIFQQAGFKLHKDGTDSIKAVSPQQFALPEDWVVDRI